MHNANRAEKSIEKLRKNSKHLQIKEKTRFLKENLRNQKSKFSKKKLRSLASKKKKYRKLHIAAKWQKSIKL